MAKNATVLLKWSGNSEISFFISKKKAQLFEDLKISGSCSTEEKTTNNAGFTNIKASKPFTVSMTAELFATLGVDVKKAALSMAKSAQKGKTGYLYLGKNKLFTSALALTKADVSDIEMTPNGTWVSCKVSMTFSQSEAGDAPDGSGNPSGGGGSGYAGYAIKPYTNAAGIVVAGWHILSSTPSNKSQYTQTVTINGKKYHGYTATTTTNDTPSKKPTSRRQYTKTN